MSLEPLRNDGLHDNAPVAAAPGRDPMQKAVVQKMEAANAGCSQYWKRERFSVKKVFQSAVFPPTRKREYGPNTNKSPDCHIRIYNAYKALVD